MAAIPSQAGTLPDHPQFPGTLAAHGLWAHPPTMLAIMAGLLRIMWATGTGSEAMRRLAAPIVGGMISSMLPTLIVIPAIYALVKEGSIRRVRSRPIAKE